MQYKLNIQGGFLTGLPLKVLSVRLHSESHQKISKRQNFLMVWHFWRVFFLGGPAKKITLYILCVFTIFSCRHKLLYHNNGDNIITIMMIAIAR